jgi:hypothetical protein
MASSPSFVATGALAAVNVATANTATDGSGSITTLIQGGTNGTRVLEIHAKCAATSAAGLINIFISLDSGSTWKLFDTITISAITVSATVGGYKNSALYDALVLAGSAVRIGVTTTITQSVNVIALGGDL